MAAKELKVGDKAPSFSLCDHHGKKISLADFKDKKKVVLVFYPGDMTPGCTMQLCSIRDEVPKFNKLEAVILGINHGDALSHQVFANKHSLPFSLLVDKGKKVSSRYGAVRTYFKTKIIKRTVIVVDKHGKIIFLKRGMPKTSDVLKALS